MMHNISGSKLWFAGSSWDIAELIEEERDLEVTGITYLADGSGLVYLLETGGPSVVSHFCSVLWFVCFLSAPARACICFALVLVGH